MIDVQNFSLLRHLYHQIGWSTKTFGPGRRRAGVLDHIEKEIAEVRADPPGKSKEWVDIIILAFDGAWRDGWFPEELIDALVAKQTKNEHREWPDWRTQPTDKAIEHAERNAVFNAARVGIPLKGTTAYVPWFPCADCARALVQSGVSTVVAYEPDMSDPRWGEDFLITRVILSEAGVTVKLINKEH
jgi:hypothetical protein